MTTSQKLEQELWFLAVLRFSKDNTSYVWPNAEASYKIVNGKFKPNGAKSSKAMVSTTTKEFQEKFMVK
jgi:hypothetical protein